MAHNPAGQLLFRYKHGWILINPAIPSRGHGAGGGAAIASHFHHISGGVTHGHFESAPGGKGKRFVPDKHTAYGGQISQQVKAHQAKLLAAHMHKAKTFSDEAAKLKPGDKQFENFHKIAAYHHAAVEKIATMQGGKVLAKSHHDAAQKHLDIITAAHDAKPKPLTAAEKKAVKDKQKAIEEHWAQSAKKSQEAVQAAKAAEPKVSSADKMAYLEAKDQAQVASEAAQELGTKEAHQKAIMAHVKAFNLSFTPEQEKYHNDKTKLHSDAVNAPPPESGLPKPEPVGHQPIKMTGNPAKDSAAILKQYNAAIATMGGSMNDPTPEELALVHAAQQSKANWKKKYGTTWTKAAAEAGKPASELDYGSTFGGNPGPLPNAAAAAMTPKQLAEKYYPEAAKLGYVLPNTQTSLQGDWKPPSKSAAQGVYVYSGSSYGAINGQLRKYGPTGGSNDATIAKIDKVFSAAPPLKEKIVLGRKISGKGPFPPIPPGAEPGSEFVDKGYGSASKMANMWSGDTHIEIRVPAGMKALDLNHTTGSANPSEQEVLLPRNTRYRVISDSQTGGVRNLVVEVVGQNG